MNGYECRCDRCGQPVGAGDKVYLMVSATIDNPHVILSLTGVGASGTNKLVHQACVERDVPDALPDDGSVRRSSVLDGFADL